MISVDMLHIILYTLYLYVSCEYYRNIVATKTTARKYRPRTI